VVPPDNRALSTGAFRHFEVTNAVSGGEPGVDRMWHSVEMVGGHLNCAVRAVLVVGLCAGLLTACSGSQGSTSATTSSSTTRPGTGGVIQIKKVPLTAARVSSLVTDGCLAEPGTSASLASAVAAFHREGTAAIRSLDNGPWGKVVGISGIQDQPRYAAIAADARELDRVTIAALNTGELAPVTPVLNRIRADCIDLGRAVN